MNFKSKLKIFLILLGIFLILPNIRNLTVSPDKVKDSDDSKIYEGTKLNSAGFWNLDFIHIDGNWSDAQFQEPSYRHRNVSGSRFYRWVGPTLVPST